MRWAPILPVLIVSAGCAPAFAPARVPPPSAVATVMLAGGPEGESAIPASRPTVTHSPESRPTLATVAVVPATPAAAAIERLRDKELMIPVAGASPSKIEDSFAAGRDGDRQHNAVDILAPRNTPVVAADDGTILRLSKNTLGGITIYAADRDRHFVYYYAHLDHYRRGVTVGQKIQKGDTLGFVGTTGNAPKDIPHLHFQIMLWPSDGKYWNGEPVNPYPVFHGLASSGGARLRFD
jgi:murein DD-endopeptidase MepM/ murein hydrolase activator NlpD